MSKKKHFVIKKMKLKGVLSVSVREPDPSQHTVDHSIACVDHMTCSSLYIM